jgi:hypothetical protein
MKQSRSHAARREANTFPRVVYLQVDAGDLEVVRNCIHIVEQKRLQRQQERAQHALACRAEAAQPGAGGDGAPSEATAMLATMSRGAVATGDAVFDDSPWSWIPATNDLEGSAGADRLPPEATGRTWREVVTGALGGCACAVQLQEWQAWARRRSAAMSAAYHTTTVHERDCILASRIRDVAESAAPGRPVVAVVGANHVPGIVHAWSSAHTPAFEAQCSSYLSVPEHPPQLPHAWKLSAIDTLAWGFEGAAAMAAAGGGAAIVQRCFPGRTAAVLGAAAAGVLGLGVHTWWSAYRRPAQLVANLASFNDAAQAP